MAVTASLLAAFLVAPLTAHAADPAPDPVAQRLAAIRQLVEESRKVCETIPMGGYRNETERKAEASAKLNNVLSKIVDVGASGALRSDRTEFENVAQDKLADLLKERGDCKANFVRDMAPIVLAPVNPSKPNP